jgi:ribose-phosphate pyrophosphokinase
VFVIQPTCAPTAENLVELLVLIDALKRASVSSVTAVVPYFGYARQDRRPRSARVPITAKVAAKMFSAVGTDRVLTVDLHADQIQGFFDIPVDNVYASPLLLADIWRAYGTDNLIVVSPDVGGVVRARAIAKRLDDATWRSSTSAARGERGHGDEHHRRRERQDLRARGRHRRHRGHAVRGGRGAEGAGRDQGGRVLHAPGAVGCGDRQHEQARQLDELVVTDTIPLSAAAKACSKIRQLSVAELLAETIRRIAFGESVSSLYVD